MRKPARTFLICLSLMSMLFGTVYAQGTPLVNKIEIRGLKRIEEGAIRTKISQKPGEAVSQEKTNEDIRTIFKMGYFEDVKIELEAFEGGIRLIYIVKEKPTIIRVDFQGNKELDDAKLKEKITITPGSIADTVLIQDNAAKLRSFYEEEGYWLANVVPVTKKISGDDISLTYQIDEGTKIKLKRLSFEGNKHISASRIKKAMETSEWWIFSFLSSSSGYYKKDRMEGDVEKIRNLYYNEGYLKVIVGEPQITLDKDKKYMSVTISIAEGDAFSVSSVEFTGNKTFDNETIKKLITITPNSVFRKNILEKNIQAVSGLYTENGYAMVSITPDLAPDEKNRTVKVVLAINEGSKYRIGRIEVSGNLKTRDKVIRRELRFDEGEVFNSTKLRRSYERVNNLNFFESVDIVPKPRAEEVVDLEVRVKERATGMLSVGGGYSSVDHLIGTVDLTQGNLFGKGQFVKVKAELGGKSSFYELSFRDPWFRDRPIALSTGIYRTTREFSEYSKKAFGFYVGFGKDFSEYWKGDISYNFERATIYDIKAGASTIVFDQKGTRSTSSITPSIIRDSRDNYLDPSKGSRNALSVTFAGLGGNNDFIKTAADSAWYFPIWRESSVMLRGRIGYAKGIFNKTLPLYERFYVGGISTLRGIGFGLAGPKDPATGEAIGGTTELLFNTEYIFPILTDMKLKGVVFFDAGNSYEEFNEFGKLRYTSGTGIRWISPIGPIRIEWGYNIKKKPGESSSKVEFAFGSFF